MNDLDKALDEFDKREIEDINTVTLTREQTIAISSWLFVARAFVTAMGAQVLLHNIIYNGNARNNIDELMNILKWRNHK